MTDNDTVRLVANDIYYLFNIFTDKRLRAGDVREGETEKLFDRFQGDLFFRMGGIMKTVTNVAACFAAVGNDKGVVECSHAMTFFCKN